MSRLDALLDLHRQDPDDADLLFMIATEHASAGQHAQAIEWLRRYVEKGRDVGAGWALMADCHAALGDASARRDALTRGIDAAMRAGHPSLAGEMRERLESGED